jgi:hypothetical protein
MSIGLHHRQTDGQIIRVVNGSISCLDMYICLQAMTLVREIDKSYYAENSVEVLNDLSAKCYCGL